MYPAPTNNQAATTNYDQAFASFGSVYDPQVQQVQSAQAQAVQDRDSSLAQLSQDNTTKLSQLDQAKVNAFSTNKLNSNTRGLLFSGYTPAQNDAYTTNVYNPNVEAANTNYKRNVDSTNTNFSRTSQTLAEKINQINQARANDAYGLVENTKQAQAQAAKQAAAEAKANAAARSSAAKATAKVAKPTTAQVAAAISSGLAKVTGRNGYVAPEDYAGAYIDWIRNGGTTGSFNSNFGRFKDPTNGYYGYAITQALKRG